MTALRLQRPDGSAASVTLTRAAADDDAPVVLLVPAMGMRAGYYAPLAEALAAVGVATAVTELRGHEADSGSGPARRPGRDHDFGYGELAADLGAAVDLVAAALPAAPRVLLGHSMGGHVSAAYVAEHATRVAGLVLVASGTTYWRAWPRRTGQLVRTQAAMGVAHLLGHFPGDRVGFAGREARGVMRDWGRLARTGRLATGRPPRDLTPALREVTLPVLAVSVEHDELSPRRTVTAMAALFASADVSHAHLVGSAAAPLDHFRWARQPGEVVDVVRGWLPRALGDDDASSPRGRTPFADDGNPSHHR